MTEPEYIVWNPAPEPYTPINSAEWLGFPAETIEMEKPTVKEIEGGVFVVEWRFRQVSLVPPQDSGESAR